MNDRIAETMNALRRLNPRPGKQTLVALCVACGMALAATLLVIGG